MQFRITEGPFPSQTFEGDPAEIAALLAALAQIAAAGEPSRSGLGTVVPAGEPFPLGTRVAMDDRGLSVWMNRDQTAAWHYLDVRSAILRPEDSAWETTPEALAARLADRTSAHRWIVVATHQEEV